MKEDQEDLDPLRIKEWFNKPYSVAVTTLLFFFLFLYPAWSYIVNWFETVLIKGLVPEDVSFIKALSFILVLLIANITYMVLSKQVSLSRTVVDREKKLHYSEKKFQSFIEHVPNVAVQGFDPDCTVRYWNRASEKMYGYPKKEALGNKMTQLIIPAENREEFTTMVNCVETDGEIITKSETTFVKKNGESVPVFSSYSAVQVPETQLEIFSMEIDLTERKRMEEDLKRAKILAEASNSAKSKFLANMSHELRTPLNSIIGFSDLLLTQHPGPLNERQKKYANNVSISGNHLLGIINDILDISKAEAGKIELRYEIISVSRVLTEVVEVMTPSAASRGLTINVNLGSGVEHIQVDSVKFKQILYNLVGNSVKFSDNGGKITIWGRTVGGYVHFEVEDNGIGIRPEDMDKLFTPFTQIDSSTTKEYGGTGLGLSLVKKLVEMHGGDVWVKSEYGKYSIFGFSIPMECPIGRENAG